MCLAELRTMNANDTQKKPIVASSRHLEAEAIYRGTLDTGTLAVYAPFSPLETCKG